VHVAVFTAGALLGGGLAVAVTNKRNAQHPVLLARPAAAPLPVPVPAPRLEQTALQPTTFVGKDVIPSPALRYGHPGERHVFSMVG
jgi:endonuclease G